MSNNTNNIFGVICGAVVVTTIFLLIGNNQDNALMSAFGKMNDYFQSGILDSKQEGTQIENGEQEETPEINPEEEALIAELYDKYTAKGWNIIDIAVEKGVAAINYNVYKNGNGHYSWQILVINTNDYAVHLKNLKWTYFDSNTHEVILKLSPYEWELQPNGMVMSGTTNTVPITLIDHYLVFTWGD